MSDADVRHSPPMERTIGLVGIVGTVLLFTSVIAGSAGEPPLDATAPEAAEYLKGLDAPAILTLEAVGDIAIMVLLGFLVGLPLLLRRHEGEVPVRSSVAMLSGALVAAFCVLDSAEEAGAHRAADLDQGQLAYAYDLTTVGFTNLWLPLGTFAFACGWLMVSTRAMPAWLGWWGVVAGTALGFAQLGWKIDLVWLVPYLAVWLWLMTTCVVLVRRPSGRPGPEASDPVQGRGLSRT